MRGGKGCPPAVHPGTVGLSPYIRTTSRTRRPGDWLVGLWGTFGRRMRPTWGIDGCGVAKHGRILSSDRVYVHSRVDRREVKR